MDRNPLVKALLALVLSSLLWIGCGPPHSAPRDLAGAPVDAAGPSGGEDLALPSGDGRDLGPSADASQAPSAAIHVVAPTGQTVLGAPFTVSAKVQTTEPVKSVVATLAGQSFPLSPGQPGSDVYSVDGVQPPGDGHATLTVTLETTTGLEAKDELVLDYLGTWPTLTVQAPLAYEVALPSLHVDATCNSGLPGCQVAALLGGCAPASGPSAMAADHLVADVTPDAAWDGSMLCLRAVDRAGHEVHAKLPIQVETSPAYQRVYDAAEEILDVNLEQPTRQLVRAALGWPTTYGMNTVVDESLPMTIVLETGAAPPSTTIAEQGFRRGKERFFISSTGVGGMDLLEGGVLWAWSPNVNEFVASSVAAAPSVHGDWAAALGGTTAYAYQFSKLGNGASTTLGTAESVDIGANGVTAWTTPITGSGASCSGGDLYFGGVKAQTAGMKWDVRTDGTLAVYRWQGACAAPSPSLALYDGTTQSFAPMSTFAVDYQVSHGWVVALFETSSPVQLNALWRRSPAGDSKTVATPIAFPLLLETLGADGSLTYLSGTTRHLVDAAGTDHEIGNVHGHAYAGSDGWYIALGRSLFRVVTQ